MGVILRSERDVGVSPRFAAKASRAPLRRANGARGAALVCETARFGGAARRASCAWRLRSRPTAGGARETTMRALVVKAHPVEDSFCAATTRAVVEGLDAGGASVDLADLYAEGFQPLMTREDRLLYHAIPENRALAQGFAERLEAADALVMVFPTWINGPPSMLKGWLEKVMLPGLAFDLGPYRPKLRHLKLVAGVTTYGGSRLRNAIAGDASRKMATRLVPAYTGWRAKRRYFALYGIDLSTPDQRTAFLDRVREGMKALA
ncbi:MAG: flavodoxin family protein [Rhodobacteraceae bacterium]|nr:MAG: flavodoxin family protein [Paracoccaceae bacterium]